MQCLLQNTLFILPFHHDCSDKRMPVEIGLHLLDLLLQLRPALRELPVLKLHGQDHHPEHGYQQTDQHHLCFFVASEVGFGAGISIIAKLGNILRKCKEPATSRLADS